MLVFATVLDAHSQSKFICKYGTVRDEMPYCIKQIGDKYFTSVTIKKEQNVFWGETTIMSLNNDGKINKELSFTCTDSSYKNIYSIYPIDDSEFLAIGACKNKELPVSQFWIMKMDTALNIIWEKKYKTNQPYNGTIEVTKNDEGNFLLGTTLMSGSPSWVRSIMFIEINQNGDSLQSSCLTDGDQYHTYLEDLMWIDGHYKAFVTGYGSYTPTTYAVQILNLDTNLNLLQVRDGPYDFDTPLSSIKINDSAYYLTGMVHFYTTHYDVSIAKLSNNEDSLAFNHVGGPNNIADYSGWVKCVSFFNNNNIYTGGYTDGFGYFYCSNMNRVLMLSNFDSLLNCRWTRFYGSDACYTFNTMDATTDGGCIIAGMYCDPANPANQLDMIIIKVDSTGLFTSNSENQPVTSHEAIVYPNPGLNRISIQSGPQLAGAELSMYDASGTLVLKNTLVSTFEQKDVSHLDNGIYFWQVIYNQKVIEKGTWIKQ